MPRSARHSAAFTLLEVLVASAVTALIVALLALSVRTAQRGRRSALDGLDTQRTARLALETLAADLRGALPPTGTLARGFTLGDSANATFAGSSSWVTGAGSASSLLQLYTTADPLRQADGRSDVQEVTYDLVAPGEVRTAADAAAFRTDDLPGYELGPLVTAPMPDAADPNARVLVRRVRRSLLAPIAATPPDQVLCRRVRTLTLAAYDGAQWVAAYDAATHNGALPAAVSITLEVAAEEASATVGSSFTLTRTVRLPTAVVGSAGNTPTP